MSDARQLPDLLYELYESINRHDLDDLLRHFRPNAVLVSPAGVAEGHEEIAWHYEQIFTAFPDLAFTPWESAEPGDPALTEWTVNGTHTGPFLMPNGHALEATGRRVTVRGCSACEMEDDLIVTHRVYFDQLELYSQLGCDLTPTAS
ncbi:transcriptional regulator [Planotetraspora silvatica]|uniref:Transcriptional regulator n=1 Tax=Planotetraspora silvatica TaxID=234614 RepID=A0A8J3XRG0_9ACTN|nr:ester cyclase [Planotetraspora silvatica]GII50165.1 transcriptional regulator [Planotetraspora silvatica]